MFCGDERDKLYLSIMNNNRYFADNSYRSTENSSEIELEKELEQARNTDFRDDPLEKNKKHYDLTRADRIVSRLNFTHQRCKIDRFKAVEKIYIIIKNTCSVSDFNYQDILDLKFVFHLGGSVISDYSVKTLMTIANLVDEDVELDTDEIRVPFIFPEFFDDGLFISDFLTFHTMEIFLENVPLDIEKYTIDLEVIHYEGAVPLKYTTTYKKSYVTNSFKGRSLSPALNMTDSGTFLSASNDTQPMSFNSSSFNNPPTIEYTEKYVTEEKKIEIVILQKNRCNFNIKNNNTVVNLTSSTGVVKLISVHITPKNTDINEMLFREPIIDKFTIKLNYGEIIFTEEHFMKTYLFDTPLYIILLTPDIPSKESTKNIMLGKEDTKNFGIYASRFDRCDLIIHSDRHLTDYDVCVDAYNANIFSVFYGMGGLKISS